MSTDVTQDWARALGRLEGKVDQVLVELEQRRAEHVAAALAREENTAKLTERLARVERRQFHVAGAAGFAGALLTTLIAIAGVLPK